MPVLMLRALALLAALMFSAGLHAAQSLPAQTTSQSGVTIKVTPRPLEGGAWAFDVILDTHSQELKDELLKSAVLVSADGAQVSPVQWQGDAPGGHHRKGVLRFNPVTPAPGVLELRITRPGEPTPRTYRWTP